MFKISQIYTFECLKLRDIHVSPNSRSCVEKESPLTAYFLCPQKDITLTRKTESQPAFLVYGTPSSENHILNLC
jgi:hypothetical protein